MSIIQLIMLNLFTSILYEQVKFELVLIERDCINWMWLIIKIKNITKKNFLTAAYQVWIKFDMMFYNREQ
jgi:hypothetical protein